MYWKLLTSLLFAGYAWGGVAGQDRLVGVRSAKFVGDKRQVFNREFRCFDQWTKWNGARLDCVDKSRLMMSHGGCELVVNASKDDWSDLLRHFRNKRVKSTGDLRAETCGY